MTALTNGAAGIVPAVLHYFRDFCLEYSDALSRDFLLTAAAIGSLMSAEGVHLVLVGAGLDEERSPERIATSNWCAATEISLVLFSEMRDY